LGQLEQSFLLLALTKSLTREKAFGLCCLLVQHVCSPQRSISLVALVKCIKDQHCNDEQSQ